MREGDDLVLLHYFNGKWRVSAAPVFCELLVGSTFFLVDEEGYFNDVAERHGIECFSVFPYGREMDRWLRKCGGRAGVHVESRRI